MLCRQRPCHVPVERVSCRQIASCVQTWRWSSCCFAENQTSCRLPLKLTFSILSNEFSLFCSSLITRAIRKNCRCFFFTYCCVQIDCCRITSSNIKRPPLTAWFTNLAGAAKWYNVFINISSRIKVVARAHVVACFCWNPVYPIMLFHLAVGRYNQQFVTFNFQLYFVHAH